MQTRLILLLGLAAVLACAMTCARGRTKPAWSQHLKGWQKVFGAIAVVLTLLVILNPEFLALGLLGDTAFFDMLVLALSLQMHLFAARALRSCMSVLTSGMRWMGIPSPGLRYLLALWALAIGSAVSTFQKVVHRISS
jgi:uncharacterized membrane protein YkgB